MYDTSDHPEDIRHTNPEYLRSLARRLERTAATLTEGSVADYALNVSREIEDTAVDISWTLGTITNDLVVSYSRDTKRPLAGNGAVLAAAASGCAAPLGNALKHLATAADRLAAPHAVHRAENAAVQVPEARFASVQGSSGRTPPCSTTRSPSRAPHPRPDSSCT